MSTAPFPDVFRPAAGALPRRTYVALPGVEGARVLVEAGAVVPARRVLAALRPRTDAPAGARGLARGVATEVGTLGVGVLGKVRPRHTTMDVAAGPDAIESYVARHLGRGRAEVAFGWRFGPPRANRKPVGCVVAEGGSVLAFVKVGVTPLTGRLVEAEGAALARLGPRVGPLTLPGLLHRGRWQDLPVLVTAPLRHTGRRGGEPDRRAAAEIAVAGALGIRRESLGASAFWAEVTQPADDPDPRWAPLRAATRQVAAHAGGRDLVLGAWHGDWTAHNVVATRAGIGAWDWERFRDGVPAGFDPLHYRLMAALESGAPRADLVPDLVREAPRLLAHLGAAGLVDDPAMTAVLYLLTLARRYQRDGQDRTGSVAAGFADWLVAPLPAAVGSLVGRAGEVR
ncbi:MAG: hypothetical protein IPH03_00715 [Tetrasphaera sp.]|nr:hypothetical protein [Tetrasphaera sp.]